MCSSWWRLLSTPVMLRIIDVLPDSRPACEFILSNCKMGSRAILAAAIAAAIVVGAAGVGLYAVAGIEVPMSNFGHGMFFLFLFGWPIAFGITAIVGVATTTALRRRGRTLSFRRAVLTAAAVGAVGLPLVWFLFWESRDALGTLSLLGGVAGLLGGASFWLLARG
jgi:hypothetical protein